jgi:hypothetical protein
MSCGVGPLIVMRFAMDTYNARKMHEIAERLLSSADEIMEMLQTVERGARALQRAAASSPRGT